MRVLLAGASGDLGRHLVPRLAQAGHAVTAISRRAENTADLRLDTVVADILDRPALLDAVAGREFDAVVHEATDLRRQPRRYSHLGTTNRLRTEGTSALIAAAKATGATRFVTASVVYGYGFETFGERVLDEDAAFGERPGGPVDAVFRSLLGNEQQARAFGGVALRYGLFYGGRGGAPVVASDWRGELPFVHIDDAAAATVAALDAAPGSVYNVVDDTPASWREVQEARAEAFGLRAPARIPSWLLRRVAPFGAELLAETSMRVSNARARAELGWAPAYPSYVDGIAAAVEEAARLDATGTSAAATSASSPSRASGAAHGSV
jgi:nucleoside-diphosphate-sugar epimerase